MFSVDGSWRCDETYLLLLFFPGLVDGSPSVRHADSSPSPSRLRVGSENPKLKTHWLSYFFTLTSSRSAMMLEGTGLDRWSGG